MTDESTGVECPQPEFFCPQCDYAGTERQVHGHIGAKHVRKLKPIKHGTVAGYKAEKRRGLTTCPACKTAWRRYYAALRVKAKAGASRVRKGL